ncbi:MAG TPA: SDR family oxidoreductase [Flavipsychrobacter sp.]
MSNQNIQLAVITGACGGIGSAYAQQLAGSGYDLLLIDRNTSQLAELANSLNITYGISPKTIAADFGDATAVDALALSLAKLEHITMFINTAGFSENTLFEDEKMDFIMTMINVHIIAMIKLTHAVLPGMLKQKNGAIITVSSLSAFLPAPKSSVYSATKAFINNFMTSLHTEVSGKGIHVQALCPGLTHTNFHIAKNNRRFSKHFFINPWMEPEDVVKISLKKLNSNTVICIPGFLNKFLRKASTLAPRKLYYQIAMKQA